jgi:hypothetical protein
MTTGLIPEFALQITNLYAPASTSIPMANATAPLGWVSAAISDTSLRYNSGSGGTSGGSTNWSSWNFGGTQNCNGFALSIAQLPAHSHVDAGHTHGDAGHQHSLTDFQAQLAGNTGGAITGVWVNTVFGVATTTGFANIQTSNANIQNTGSGATITPTFTTPQVKYVDHILAVKS